MSEEAAKYGDQEEVTAATVVALLEEARHVMVSRMERHARRAARAKSSHDKAFHNSVALDSQTWIARCDFLVSNAHHIKVIPKVWTRVKRL